MFSDFSLVPGSFGRRLPQDVPQETAENLLPLLSSPAGGLSDDLRLLEDEVNARYGGR